MRSHPTVLRRPRLLLLQPACVAAATALLSPAIAHGQATRPPITITACYVPATGTVYRIDMPAGTAPGAPTACSATHVQFTWNQQGPKGDKGDPGDAGKSSGVFSGGLIATDLDSLAIPVGAGRRFMWIPQKSAIRAGASSNAYFWDPRNIGVYSAAFGTNTRAEGRAAFAAGELSSAVGTNSVALGYSAAATGTNTVALGSNNEASGLSAIALGESNRAYGSYSFAAGVNSAAVDVGTVAIGATAVASGVNAVAIGLATTANGANSMALGRNASTNHRAGAFVYGDGSGAATAADADNQFYVGASGGVKLRTSSDRQRGCDVSTTGTMACTGGLSAGPETFRRIVGGYIPVAAGRTSAIESLACPGGYAIAGGGVETGTENLHVRASYPDYTSDRWFAVVRNEDIINGKMRIYATCFLK